MFLSGPISVSMRILLLCLAALCVCGVAPGQTERAVIVGINRYKPENAPTTSANGRPNWRNLQGSVNDATAIRELLIARFGFKPENIVLLTDQQATHDAILNAIKTQLLEKQKAGDVSFFYYAGHGSQVYNSLSDEADHLDETLVPADAYGGAPDIRDKEIARLFKQIRSKDVYLTAIFDSCHSGGIWRGLPGQETLRVLPPAPKFDARDPGPTGPTAVEQGAIIITSAEDFQPAGEFRADGDTVHGAFTAALIRVLQTAPTNQSVVDLFRQVRAIMQSSGKPQEPSLAVSSQMRDRTLLGTAPGISSPTAVAVRSVSSGEIMMEGGLAVGLAPGTELVPASKDAPPVRLKVTDASIATATARPLAGEASSIHSGELFVIDHWAAGTDALRLWLPPAASAETLTAASQALAQLRKSSQIQVVADPVQLPPDYRVWWNGTEWQLLQSNGSSRSLGAAFTAKSLEAEVPRGAKVFIDLPPTQQLAEDIRKNVGKTSGVEITSDAVKAQYTLAGTVDAGASAYAWVMPNAGLSLPSLATTHAFGSRPVKVEDHPSPALPVRTDWIDSSDRGAVPEFGNLADRLSRIYGWLTLLSPPESIAFPYRLYLKDMKSGKLLDSGDTHEYDRYGLVLKADPAALDLPVDSRYIYVFTIDSHGCTTLLYPNSESGKGQGENQFPPPPDEHGNYSPEVPLSSDPFFEVCRPFGTDTYFMLATHSPIDPWMLDNSQCVRKRAAVTDPLERLLAGVGGGTTRDVTPTDWSIYRVSVTSNGSSEKPPADTTCDK